MADDVGPAQTPMAGHLARPRRRLTLLAHEPQGELARREAQGQQHRQIAIVGDDPVLAALQGEGGADLRRLVPDGRDMEGDLPLAMKYPGPLIQSAGGDTTPARC